MHSPIVPKRKQVSFNQIQDAFDPQPEGKSLLIGTLLLDKKINTFKMWSQNTPELDKRDMKNNKKRNISIFKGGRSRDSVKKNMLEVIIF